jgi:hypothetical protein
MLRIPTFAALALCAAAALAPAEARVFAPAGVTAPLAIEQVGGRWDERPGAHRGWGYNYGDGRGYRGWEPARSPYGHGFGWGPPPRPGWYYVPPPRHYGWAPPPPPRYYPPRPRVEFGFRF